MKVLHVSFEELRLHNGIDNIYLYTVIYKESTGIPPMSPDLVYCVSILRCEKSESAPVESVQIMSHMMRFTHSDCG